MEKKEEVEKTDLSSAPNLALGKYIIYFLFPYFS